MKKQLFILSFLVMIYSCSSRTKNEDVVDITKTEISVLKEIKVLKFGDLLDSIKKIRTTKTIQKTILDFKLGMSEASYKKAYAKLNKYEYAPGRMAYDIEFQRGNPSACEFIPEFKNQKLNKLTININNSNTSYSFSELKDLLMKRYKVDPVVYDYPSSNQDALWITDGLLTGLLRAKEGAIRVDVLSFAYARDMIDEYKFLDEKKTIKRGSEVL